MKFEVASESDSADSINETIFDKSTSTSEISSDEQSHLKQKPKIKPGNESKQKFEQGKSSTSSSSESNLTEERIKYSRL